MISAFNAAGLELIILPAVWGPSLRCETIESRFDVEGTRALIGWRGASLNEIGCALSHQEVYSRAFNTECDWALVLEDDVVLSTDFLEAIKVFNLIIDSPAVISFFSRGKRFVTSKPRFNFGEANLYSCSAPPGQTAAYLINRKALELTLKFERVIGLADWPQWAYGCNFYLAYPWLVSESATDSLIPAQSLSKVSYWVWRLGVITGIRYLKDRRYFTTYSEYFFWHLKPWILRIKYKLRIIVPIDNKRIESVWISRFR